MENVFKLHGMPSAIVCDRDVVFTSSFWKELFRLHGTDILMSSAYHPQTDGQTERVNHCIETYLRCFSSTQPKQRKRWLAWGEWSYNAAFHEAIKMTPFEAVYGYSPPSIETYVRGTTNAHHVEQDAHHVEQELLTRDRILRLLRENLSVAQPRMKAQVDKQRSERSFEVGDFVYLRLQPHRQSLVAIRSFTKLAPRYYGPYRILDRIGPVAYKLELPTSSRIHPVFHVSCLKKKLGYSAVPSTTLPCLHRYGAS
ncbi:hypothetical protein MRB53_013917 [Persea americana]|uniref:Uncharacterized protein n=1 Tax=Persea americana TaxID=3435 RepID=A0ACC2K9G8_PERAE|nr:hypothetical protein MRB53_013917 [Persea americana]